MLIQSRSQTSKIIVSQYGNVLAQSNQEHHKLTYVFQGQEYDSDIGLCFFPSRLYSVDTKRFLQPDPKSQYFSPYSYLNGDPVNYIDVDGEEGKALFLYSKDHSLETLKEPGVEDLIDAVPDAYHYPITDVLNDKVGSLPEWNGRVFIISHSEIDCPALEVES